MKGKAANYIKEFLNANSEKGFFDKSLDEPTYLTFKIEFGAPLTSMVDINVKNYSLKQNSAVQTNFDLMPAALFAMDDEDFLNRNFYSAISYLKDINEFRRAEMLKEFITGMNELQSKYQYYFTEISGLENLFKIDTKRGSRIAPDSFIEISCLEGIDTKISYLMNLYRKIAWDDTWQRWILPDIMRYFNLIIYITEFRTFHASNYPNNISDSSAKSDSGTPAPLILKVLNNLAPTLRIDCKMCEFDIENLSTISTLSSYNNSKTPFQTKIRIHVKNSADIQIYPMFTYGYLDDELLNGFNRTDSSVDAIPTSYSYYFKHIGDVANNRIILPESDETHRPGRAYYQPSLNGLYEDSEGNKGNGWLNNALKWGTSFVKNKVNDYANSLLNNNIGGLNISANEIINTIKSKDIVSVFGAIRKATMDSESVYPSVPESFKDKKIDNSLFKSVLEELSISTATNKDEDFLVNSAKEILKNAELYDKINNMTREQLEKRLSTLNLQDVAEQQSGYDRSRATDLDKKKQIIGFEGPSSK